MSKPELILNGPGFGAIKKMIDAMRESGFYVQARPCTKAALWHLKSGALEMGTPSKLAAFVRETFDVLPRTESKPPPHHRTDDGSEPRASRSGRRSIE